MYSQEGNVAGMGEGEEMLVEDEVREVGTGVEGADRVDLLTLTFTLTSHKIIEQRSNTI